ncbi:MAG: hypothetical protein R3E58_18645 [Phycisphaerae bacterium]
MKAANIPKLVEYGAHDLGMTGFDWIEETDADVAELLDTGLLPVRLVSAAPKGSDPFASENGQSLIVASEYENITRKYMERKRVRVSLPANVWGDGSFSTRRCRPDRGQHGHRVGAAIQWVGGGR